MAKALRFGDESTAEIKLQLIGADGTEHQADPLYVHSDVLRKSEYYETRLSDRWSADEHTINIATCHGDGIYSKCIQLMYRSHANPFVSQMWTKPKQEVKLRALLLSLEINPLPDLAVRLGLSQSKSDNGGLPVLEQSLQKMLSTISRGSFDHGEYIEEYMVAHFEANVSFAETCRSALLKEFSVNVERAK